MDWMWLFNLKALSDDWEVCETDLHDFSEPQRHIQNWEKKPEHVCFKEKKKFLSKILIWNSLLSPKKRLRLKNQGFSQIDRPTQWNNPMDWFLSH